MVFPRRRRSPSIHSCPIEGGKSYEIVSNFEHLGWTTCNYSFSELLKNPEPLKPFFSNKSLFL